MTIYRYDRTARILSVAQVALFLIFAIALTDLFYRILSLVLAAFLFRDAIRTFTRQMYTTDKGLIFKDAFGEQVKLDWFNLEYITITKKNKHWVALVTPDGITYLKKHIDNPRGLLKDIIRYAKKNKDLMVHDRINEIYQLGLKLNDEGKLRP
jgi:hypothetical protein